MLSSLAARLRLLSKLGDLRLKSRLRLGHLLGCGVALRSRRLQVALQLHFRLLQRRYLLLRTCQPCHRLLSRLLLRLQTRCKIRYLLLQLALSCVQRARCLTLR